MASNYSAACGQHGHILVLFPSFLSNISYYINQTKISEMAGGFIVTSNDEGVCGCLLGPTVEPQHLAVFLGHFLAAQILQVTHSLTISTKGD